LEKGQTAIEFIFIVLLVVVYIVTVTTPLVGQTKNIMNDTANVSIANNETQKIFNQMQEISLSGVDSKKTFTIIVPDETTIICRDANISFETKVKQKPFPAQCTTVPGDAYALCIKTFTTRATLECRRQSIDGPTKASIILIKTTDSNVAFLTGE
jgi:Flp pilus assembly pilin Flp